MLRIFRPTLVLFLIFALCSVALANHVYLEASLSASDARPGDVLTATVGVQGCDLPLNLWPVQGVLGVTREITSTAMQNISLPVRVQRNAWPGLRYMQFTCGGTTKIKSLNIVDAGWIIHVPMARR